MKETLETYLFDNFRGLVVIFLTSVDLVEATFIGQSGHFPYSSACSKVRNRKNNWTHFCSHGAPKYRNFRFLSLIYDFSAT